MFGSITSGATGRIKAGIIRQGGYASGTTGRRIPGWSSTNGTMRYGKDVSDGA